MAEEKVDEKAALKESSERAGDLEERSVSGVAEEQVVYSGTSRTHIAMAKLHLPFNTRRAIRLAHRKLCVYCGEPIAFTDLDIEHIIPETRGTKR